MGRDEENALLTALIELHRKKQRNKPRASDDTGYARVLDHFEKRNKRLRGERLLTEELIASAFGDARKPTASAQQELEIVGTPGGTAAGRFRIHNRAAHVVHVECIAGEPLGSGPTPALHFEPRGISLASGASVLVRVVADLGAFRAPGSCTVPVECRAGFRRDRLWLIVTALGEREEAR